MRIDFTDIPSFSANKSKKRAQPIPLLSGGAMDPETRKRYMELSDILTSRVSRDYDSTIRELLDIVKADVISYIGTEIPEDDRESLLDLLKKIYDSIVMTDNPIIINNIVSLQISLLFTQYRLSKIEGLIIPKNNNNNEGLSPNNNEGIPPNNNPESLSPSQNPQHIEHYFPGSGDYDLYNLLINRVWTTYTVVLEKLKVYPFKFQYLCKYPTIDEYGHPIDILYTTSIPNDAFISFVSAAGIISVSYLVTSLLNNTFYCALTYENEIVDGALSCPYSTLVHDLDHLETYLDIYKKHSAFIIRELKPFYAAIQAGTKSKEDKYCITFILFIFLHELFTTPDNFLKESVTETYIVSELHNILFRISDMDNLGQSIPRAYREVTDKKLNEDKVKEFIALSAGKYVELFNEYLASKTTTSGGRKRHRKTKRARKGKRRHTRR